MTGIEREKVGPLPFWGWALVCGLLVWLLYVLTLAPTTGFWDTSEYIATAHIVGLPHPPGNPFFVMFGRVWLLALSWTGLSVAMRINLLSATMSAASAVFWFLAVARIWAHFTEDRRQVLVASFAAIIVGATAFTVWTQSNLNEKVYTVSLFTIALVTYLAMLWEDESGTPRGNRLLLLIAFLLGLGVANHTMSALPVLALGAFVLWHHAKVLLKWQVVMGGLLCLLIGFTVQTVFVPIRSAQNPIIDEADPECVPLSDAFVPWFHKDRFGTSKLAVRCEPLAMSLIRDQYGKPPLRDRVAPYGAQLANYWQYLDWQWARGLGPSGRLVFSFLFLFFAFLGLWQHWKGDRDSFIYFGTLLFTFSLLLIVYLNFKYGYSLYPEFSNDLHEVRERDYFYIVSFYLWGIYAGLGIAGLWQMFADRWGELDGRPRLAAASPVLAFALIPLILNFNLADRRGDYAARDWAYNLLQSVEPYGVLFTNGDNDTFPLWYLQEVEGIRRDVTVIVHSYLGTDWYPKQLRELTKPCPPGVDPADTPTVVVCQRPFDAEAAVGPYRGMQVTPPTRSILALDDEAIDGLPVAIRADSAYRISGWAMARVPEGAIVSYPDILSLHIAQQAAGDRPIYYAATAPPVYQAWNLHPHLIRQGLAFKLALEPLEPTADTVYLGTQVAEIPWVDRERTNELLWNVFQLDYLLDWERWPEPSTRGSIPAQYYLAYATLGMAEELVENPDAADAALDRAGRLLELAELNLGPDSN